MQMSAMALSVLAYACTVLGQNRPLEIMFDIKYL